MIRVRSSMHVGIAAAALALCVQSASASQLNLVPVLQISGQYSDNVFFSENNKRSDTFFLVNPGIGLDYASKRVVASLAYQVGLQRYTDFDDRDNTVHRINGNIGVNLSSGFYFELTDNLYITDDPLAFDASGDRVQRDSFTFNRITPGLSYIFGSRDIRIAGNYDRVDIDYDSLVDSVQNGFGAGLSGKLGSRSTAGVDFFYFKREFDDQRPEFNVIDYTGTRYGFTVDRRISPRLSLRGLVGYEKREFDTDSDARNYDSMVFEASATGEVPEVFSWTAAFSQHLNDLAIRGAYKIQRFNFDLRKSLADRLRIEFSGYFQNSKNDQLSEEADYFGYRMEGQYLVAKFLNVWLGYEHIDRNSDQLNPFQENRVHFGLTLSYGL